MRGVALSGLGLVSALGRGPAAHLAALRSGATGLRALELFEAAGIPSSPVGTVDPAHLAAGHPRTEALALAAAKDALAGFSSDLPGAIIVGTTTGGIYESEQQYLQHRGTVGAQDRELLRYHAAGVTADRLSRLLSLQGERHTFSTACSSSANALGYAAALVEQGLPWALAGGVDSLSRITYGGFYSLKLLSSAPCKPFDRARQGLSLGEGAAFVLLEPAARARARGARIFGYVSGWGCAADAHHITSPHPEGKGAVAAIKLALSDANVRPDEIDYVNAHGTATPANDKAEGLALEAVFGPHGPPVSSTKGATGHTLGAAGALEAGLCVLCLEEGFAPHTVGLAEPDPALTVTHVPRGGVHRPMRVALSNSFGFGGNNAALVLATEER